VVEDPAWRWRAAAAVGLGLLLAAATRRVDWRLTALGLALGNALVFAWSGTVPGALLPGLRLAAAVNLTGQALLAWLLLEAVRRRLAGAPSPAVPSAAASTAHLRALLRRGRLPPRDAWLDDLTFLFTWTAALLQLLLVIDPRYRDFPTPSFAVPLLGVAVRGALLRDFPQGGGGREDFSLAAVLILGAAASAVQEGFSNRQALVWSAAALALAAPSGRRLLAAARPSLPAIRPAHPR
jgi:hypothetical protein